MKLSGAKADAFVRAPDIKIRAILLFGPDGGLIRERAKALVAFFADETDPFAITELSGDAVRKDGALLSDSTNAMSLMGSAAVTNIRDVTDSVAPTVEDWLNAGAGAKPAIFEASELATRSKLRLLFESRNDAAAIGCYPDEGRDLSAIVRDHLAQAGISIAQDAFPVLLNRLGTDRLAVRQELDKLILYAGATDGQKITISAQDVEMSIGDVKAVSLDDIAHAVASGDQRALGTALDRAFSEGTTAVGILRAVQRHLDRLHQAKSFTEKGDSVQSAVKKLRPPVFFKFVASFEAQAKAWTISDLAKALSLLILTERECKSGLDIDRAICERALLQLAQAARRTMR